MVAAGVKGLTMKRYLCGVAVLGVVAVPDWASAFHPCWAPPPPCGHFAPPPLVYAPPPVLVVPCVPVYEAPPASPRVYVVPAETAVTPPTPQPKPAPAAPPAVATPEPRPAPRVVTPTET